MRCELVAGKAYSAPPSPGSLCARCIPQWLAGPPTADTLPPILLRILVATPTAAKPWDVSQPCRGLGDVVAKITHAAGIRQKPGCGCAERQRRLNEAVPFK